MGAFCNVRFVYVILCVGLDSVMCRFVYVSVLLCADVCMCWFLYCCVCMSGFVVCECAYVVL